jgi:hypothetical protein
MHLSLRASALVCLSVTATPCFAADPAATAPSGAAAAAVR